MTREITYACALAALVAFEWGCSDTGSGGGGPQATGGAMSDSGGTGGLSASGGDSAGGAAGGTGPATGGNATGGADTGTGGGAQLPPGTATLGTSCDSVGALACAGNHQ